MRRHVLALLALCAGVFAGNILGAGTAQAQNRFFLVNETGRVIERAYVSSSRISDWGPDILGTSVLPPRERVWVVPNFRDCVLDIRVAFAGGGEQTRMQVNACGISQVTIGGGGGGGGGYVGPGPGAGATVSPGGRPGFSATTGNPSFNFVNGSGTTIREIYVSLSTENNWGGDRLGANTLDPGQRLQVNLPQGIACLVDIRVVYMDGRSGERRRVETCSVNDFVWR